MNTSHFHNQIQCFFYKLFQRTHKSDLLHVQNPILLNVVQLSMDNDESCENLPSTLSCHIYS